MDLPHHVRPRAVQALVAPFERGPSEIRGREVALLQHGPHGPVEDEDTFSQDVGERLLTLRGCSHSRGALISLTGAKRTVRIARPVYPGDMRYWVILLAARSEERRVGKECR